MQLGFKTPLPPKETEGLEVIEPIMEARHRRRTFVLFALRAKLRARSPFHLIARITLGSSVCLSTERKMRSELISRVGGNCNEINSIGCGRVELCERALWDFIFCFDEHFEWARKGADVRVRCWVSKFFCKWLVFHKLVNLFYLLQNLFVGVGVVESRCYVVSSRHNPAQNCC